MMKKLLCALSFCFASIACQTQPTEVQAFGSITTPTAPPKNPSNLYELYEEFETGACTAVGKLTGAATGTTTCTFTSSDGLHPGVMAITTGTTATEGERMITPGTSVAFGSIPRTLNVLWKIHLLSTSVQQYKDNVGYLDPTSNAEPTDGAWFAYRFSTNGNLNKWFFVTSQGGTATATPCTGTTGDISADTWYSLQIDVNATATSAVGKVNGQVCATNTTNIPTGAQQTGIGFQHFNDTGSVPVAQLSFVDYLRETAPFQVAR